MNGPPKEGDRVTVALRERSNGLLSRTEIVHSTPFPVGKTGFMANDDDRNVHYFVDEGITWVRGHVADDSPEGKALIAANALAPKFDVALALTMSMSTTADFAVHVEGRSPRPILRIGNNPPRRNPKNELGE